MPEAGTQTDAPTAPSGGFARGVWRWTRRVLTLIGGLIGFVLILLLIAVGVAQTDWGKRFIAETASDLASGPDFTLAIEGITGFVPFDMAVARVDLGDADGTWLEVEDATLTWSPLALIGQRLHINAAGAGRVALARLPAASETVEEPPAEPAAPVFEPPSLPQLPLAIDLDALTIGDVALGAGVIGEPVTASVTGTAQLGAGTDRSAVTLLVNRTDDRPGRVEVDLGWRADGSDLTTHIAASEPEGGIIVTLAGLPERPSLALNIDGGGAFTDWSGALSLDLGGQRAVEGEVAVRPEGDRLAASLEITTPVVTALPEPLPDILGAGAEIAVAATVRADGLPLVETARIASAAATVTVAGREDGAVDRYALEVSATALPAIVDLSGGWTWEEAAISAEIDRRGSSIDADLSAVWSGLAGPLPPGVAPLVESGSVDGAVGLDTESLTASFEDVALTLPDASLRASGRYGASDAEITTSIRTPRLAAFAEVAGMDLSGSASAAVDAQIQSLQPLGPIAFEVAVDGQDIETGIVEADPLLAGTSRVTAAGSADIAGEAITIERSSVTLEHLQADARGRWGPEGGAVRLVTELAEIGLVAPETSGAVRLSGEGTLAGDRVTASLSVTSEEIVSAGETARDVEINADVDGALPLPAATLAVRATARDLPLVLDAEIEPSDAGPIDLTITASGPGSTAIDGAAVVDIERLAASGRLSASADNLAPLGAAFGLPIAGSIALTAEGEGSAEAIDITYEASASDIAFDDLIALGALQASGEAAGPLPIPTVDTTLDLTELAAPSIAVASALIDIAPGPDGALAVAATVEGIVAEGAASVGTVSVEGTVVPNPDDPAVDAAIGATGIVAGGFTVDQATIETSADLESVSLAARASGSGIALDTAATADLTGDDIVVALERLTASALALDAALQAPTTVTVSPTGSATIAPTRLGVAGGAVALSGSAGAEAIALDVGIEALSIPALASVAGVEITAGSLSGTVGVSGSSAAPQAAYDLTIDGVSVPELANAGLGGVSASFAGTASPAQVTTDGTVTAGPGQLSLSGSLDLAQMAVSATANGEIDLDPVNAFLAGGADQIDGVVALDVAVNGALDAPEIGGTVLLSDGSYANPLYGVALDDATARVVAEGTNIRLESLAATTPNGGGIEASGGVQILPDGGLPMDLTLTATNAQLIDMPVVTVVTNADLDVDGDLATDLLARGRVDIVEVNARIASPAAGGYAAIEVEEINPVTPEQEARVAAQTERQARAGTQGGSALEVGLDIAIVAERNIYVDGPGLNIEMSGDLQLSGTTAAPSLRGSIDLLRGFLDFVGRRLEFTRGSIAFNGDPAQPQIEILSDTTIPGGTASIGIEGTGGDLELVIESAPPLPEDEVLALVLFGQRPEDLSAFEAVQLASLAGTLTGALPAGPGMLERIRGATGLDSVRFDVDPETGETTVGVMEEVIEDVRVGVEQGVGGRPPAVTVEIDITDNIRVNSEVSSRDSRLGIATEWEY